LRFGLTAQIQRAAVSVAANIAKGSGQQTLPNYIRFLYIAKGSLAEVDFFIANYLRFTQPAHPFNAGMDSLPLQRLTRFRKHIVEQMTVEKNYFLNHLFKKFSAYHQVQPFASVFGATSCDFWKNSSHPKKWLRWRWSHF